MTAWPDNRITALLGIEHPLIQAPMAGVDTPQLASQVTKAGGLGSLACALLSPDQIRAAWASIRSRTSGPVNLNFFCHPQGKKSAAQQETWKNRLAPYYAEWNIDPDTVADSPVRAPFDENFCAVVEAIKPPVVSFHFGLPPPALLQRVKDCGAIVLSSATTVDEAIWLEQNGCDAIIAQGAEAGGHRGMFLTLDITTQINTLSLVSQIKRTVSLPVIAAGGIADAEDIKAALVAGASAVQLGTAYLFCEEASISPLYRAALETDTETVLTNVFSGRPARGLMNRLIHELGPISSDAPEFPYAAHYVAPLRSASEKSGALDFMQLWAGEKRKPHTMNAYDLTAALCRAAQERLRDTKNLQT